MRRLSTVLAFAVVVLLGLTTIYGGVRAQDATPAADSAMMAGHPLVGTWILTDPSSAAPSVISFTSDGIVIDIETSGGSGLGSWEATGGQTAALTLVIVIASPEFAATIQVNATFEVDASGNTGSGDYSYTVVLADGTGVETNTGTVTIARLPIQPLEAEGTPIPGFPTWNPVQEEGGGPPEATPSS